MTEYRDAETSDDERGDDDSDGVTNADRNERDDADSNDSEHLDDIEDGAGCAEIWERLSERRESAREKAAQEEAERSG